VLDKVDRYLKLMEELDLKLAKAVDTHLHTGGRAGLKLGRDGGSLRSWFVNVTTPIKGL
jgi:hypothetical protein